MGVVDRLARRVLIDDIPLRSAEVAQHLEHLIPAEAPLFDRNAMASVLDTVLGLGPLEGLMRDPLVSDILVNGDGAVWVERAGALEPSEIGPIDPGQLLTAVERVLAPMGLRLDRSSPAVDARLADGSRLHAMVPPAAVDGPVVAIRRFAAAACTLDELEAMGSITAEGVSLLRSLVTERRNILVCGATGAGKTTLLNVLSRAIPAEERVVTVEDAAELRLSGHVVRLEGRPPNSEGAGAITQRELLRHALRLRPDRIIVGEVRGAEAFDMLQALSTGHEGSMSSIHASSAEEALWRLETLALIEATAVPATIARQVGNVIDAVVALGRVERRRVVRSVCVVDPEPVEVYSCS